MLKIKVPATTTNFGSGFDSLGMALNLYNEFYIEPSPSLDIIVDKEYKGYIPSDERNLIYQAAKSIYSECGLPVPGMRISQKTHIPLSRGLGSSASCIVAGLLAANEMAGAGFSKQQLLDIAVSIEGHPDNVLPALVGGFTTAMIDDGKTRYIRNKIDPKFILFFLIPPFELSTRKARGVLPDSYSRQDTVASISRALFIAESLIAGNTAGLKNACADVIHQRYRSNLIADYDTVINAAYECGADGAYLSGAGPSISAIVSSGYDEFEQKCAGRLPHGWTIIKTCPDYDGAVAEII